MCQNRKNRLIFFLEYEKIRPCYIFHFISIKADVEKVNIKTGHLKLISMILGLPLIPQFFRFTVTNLKKFKVGHHPFSVIFKGG